MNNSETLFHNLLNISVDEIETLLKNGADPNYEPPKEKYSRDFSNDSTIYRAVKSGHIDTIKLLVSYGYNLNLEDQLKRAKIICGAIYSNKIETLKYILTNGWDVPIKTKDIKQDRASEYIFDCVRYSKKPDYLKILIDHGFEPTKQHQKWAYNN